MTQCKELIRCNVPGWPDGLGKIASSSVEEPYVRDRYRNRPEVPLIRIRVAGLLTTVPFQKARLSALKLHQHLPFRFAPPEIREMLQVDWHEYIQKMRPRVGGQIWALTKKVVVFINDEYVGNDVDFQHYITQNYVFSLPTQSGYYQNLITEHYKQFIEKSGRTYVYFTFTIDNQTIGSFLFMLYSDLLPRTCQNFLSLCVGDRGETDDGIRLHYKNSLVHRIAKNGWLQCGDIQLFRGGGGCAINGATIPDESYCIPHNRRGVLSMSNDGKHSNGSQFIVCLKPNPWMDYYYVAFGQLVDGVETMERIEQIPTYYEKPLKRIIISHCGEYFFGEEPEMEAGPDLFLEHVPQPGIEGECPAPCHYIYPGFPGVTPWLDNIVDELDERDTVSLLMAERYLTGLYSLATDYLPGMDMNLPKPEVPPNKQVRLDMSCICNVSESFESYSFESMNEEEKRSLICGASKEIVACALETCGDEVCLERIAMDTTGTAQWILEIAQEVAVCAVTKAKKDPTGMIQDCGDTVGVAACQNNSIRKGCAVVEQILNKSMLHVVEAEKVPSTVQPQTLEEV